MMTLTERRKQLVKEISAWKYVNDELKEAVAYSTDFKMRELEAMASMYNELVNANAKLQELGLDVVITVEYDSEYQEWEVSLNGETFTNEITAMIEVVNEIWSAMGHAVLKYKKSDKAEANARIAADVVNKVQKARTAMSEAIKEAVKLMRQYYKAQGLGVAGIGLPHPVNGIHVFELNVNDDTLQTLVFHTDAEHKQCTEFSTDDVLSVLEAWGEAVKERIK